jgi:phosphohistidine phosphatase
MEVLFVRHGIAEDADAVDSDFSRPLTAKGRKQFRALVEWITEQGLAPHFVVSSPLVRAVQTAEILCDGAGLTPKSFRIDEHLSPGVDPAKLAAFLEQIHSPRVALVGHEPDMGHCAAEFIGGGRFAFGKGAVACVQFEGKCALGIGRLAWFLHPKLI